jgi:hypothetical protein
MKPSKRLAAARAELRAAKKQAARESSKKISAQLHKQKAAARSAEASKRVGLGRFRARVEDRGALVLLNAKGARVAANRATSRGKYTILSVGKRGAVRVVGKDGRLRDRARAVRVGMVGPQKVSDVKPYRAKGAAGAVKKLLRALPLALMSEGTKRAKPARKGKGKGGARVSYGAAERGVKVWSMLGEVAADLSRQVIFAGGGRGASMVVTVSFTFTIKGRTFTREAFGVFKVGKVSGKVLDDICASWVRSVIYAGISGAIASENGVTAGSAAFIKRLPENKGKKKDLGKRKKSGDAFKADEWGKDGYGRAVVEEMSWKIEREA